MKSMILALSSNHLFDIGFYGSDVHNYMTQKLCSCPCSKGLYPQWRKYHNIGLSEDDAECNMNYLNGPTFVEHLRSHRGWFHQAILMYLSNLFSDTWFLPKDHVHYSFKVEFVSKFFLTFGVNDFNHVYKCSIEKDLNYVSLPFTYNSSKKVSKTYSDILFSNTKISPDMRNPKGKDILYVIENNMVDTIIVSSTRYNTNKLRENKPEAQLAFCVNTNLHNAPPNGTGMLCMLHFSSNRISLAIICDGDLVGANYLIWNGSGSVSSITNAYNHDVVTLGKSWHLQYVCNQDVKGCFVNQVYGTQVKFIESQPSLTIHDGHFQSNVDGPDVIMLPPLRMLNLLKIEEHHEKYTVLYCPYNSSVKTASNLDKFAVPIYDAVPISGDFKVGTFVDISLSCLCSIENNMSLTEFTKFVISNEIGSEYRRLIPPNKLNLRIKLLQHEQFQRKKFLHCTSVCYLIHKVTKTILIRNDDYTFTVFAWGTTGGSSDFKDSI